VTIVTAALVPLASVLLGAALTYWLNVRGRRHRLVEDQFNAAILAVAVADASKYYLSGTARPPHMQDAQYGQMLANMNQAAIESHAKRLAEAREAIARLVQYEPQLAPYYRDAEALVNEPDAILRMLVDARARHI